MKKNLKNKLIITLLVLVTSLFNFAKAGVTPPPPPPNGAGGPGAVPATPIDMYQIVLFTLAILLITYFYKKIKFNKA